MSTQVKDFISKCSTSIEYSHKQAKEPLLNHPIPTRPWSKLAIDCLFLMVQTMLF